MKNTFLKPALIFTVFTVIIGFMFYRPILLSFNDPKDIYADGFDIVEHGDGGRIETEIFASYGDCASETTTTTKNGAVTSSSTDYYYIVPVYDKNDEEYYICIEVSDDNYTLFNRITNETWDFLEGSIDYIGSNVYNFEGTISELDDEVYQYMLDWFRQAEAFENETELRAHVLPLCLTTINFDAVPAFIIIFLILLALTILFWVLFFVKRSKAKAVNASAANGMAMNNEMYGASYNGAALNGVPVSNADPYNTQYNANYNNTYGNSTGYETMTINGVSYSKAALEQVNSYVVTGQTDEAIRAFVSLSGLGVSDAKNVIDNWNQLYR